MTIPRVGVGGRGCEVRWGVKGTIAQKQPKP